MKLFLVIFKTIALGLLTAGFYALWLVGLSLVFGNGAQHWRNWASRNWAKALLHVLGIKLKVQGIAPTTPCLLVANHLSYLDIVILAAQFDCVFVAKSDIKSWFLAGRICRDMGTIFIDRANRRDIPRAGDEIIERLDAGEGVVVFPEGTSTKGETVLPFNSSFLEFAARCDIPVSYASITYTTPPGELPAHLAACWWEDIGFFPHLWRLFKVKKYTAIIHFGDEPVKNHDRKALATELRDRVADRFIPVL